MATKTATKTKKNKSGKRAVKAAKVTPVRKGEESRKGKKSRSLSNIRFGTTGTQKVRSAADDGAEAPVGGVKRPAGSAKSWGELAGKNLSRAMANADDAEMSVIRLDLITWDASSGRTGDEKTLGIDELAESMRHGQLQPISVIEDEEVLATFEKGKETARSIKYVGVDGYRRSLAAKKLGNATILARVWSKKWLGRQDELRGVIVLQQLPHTEIEKALMVASLVEDETRNRFSQAEFDEAMGRGKGVRVGVDIGKGKDKSSMALINTGKGLIDEAAVLQAVAEKLGKSVRFVTDYRYLGRLDPKVLELVVTGRLPLTHAREIATLADPELQITFAQDAARSEDGAGGRSLSQLTRWVREKRFSLKVIPWEMDKPVGGKPACSSCPSNTANDHTLYSHDIEQQKFVDSGGPFCMNRACYQAKKEFCDKAREKATTKAAALLKKGEDVQPSVDGVQKLKLVPEGVKASGIVSVVRQAVKAEAPGSEGEKKPEAQTNQTSRPAIERSLKDVAKERFDEAMAHWRDLIRTKVLDGLATRAGGLSMAACMLAIGDLRAITPTYRGDDMERKMAVICQGPKVIEALAPLGKLTLADKLHGSERNGVHELHELERRVFDESQRATSGIEPWAEFINWLDDDAADASVLALLGAMGLDKPAMPVLETFLKEAGVAA